MSSKEGDQTGTDTDTDFEGLGSWADSGDPSQGQGCLTRLRSTRDKARANSGDPLERQGPQGDVGRLNQTTWTLDKIRCLTRLAAG